MKAIVLTFDRLYAGFLGCYGNQWIETPHFDRLAAESVVFDQHFGENFDHAAENHAWWTGCYQFPRSREQQRGQPTLAGPLRAAGVESRLVVEDCIGTRQVLPEFDEVVRMGGFEDWKNDDVEASLVKSVAEAEQCLQQWTAAGSTSWLLWLKLRGLPQPATTDESPWPALQSAYGGHVAALDSLLGTLRSAIQRHVESRDELLLIVTAGEGASLGKRSGCCESQARLFEEIVHTPLLVQLATAEMGTRRQALVQTVDLAPTLLDWFEIDDGTIACEGQSLLPVVRDESTSLRDYVCLGDGLRGCAIRTDELYLVGTPHGTTPEKQSDVKVYVKPDDIWEVHDVAAQSTKEMAAPAATLEEFVATARRACPAVLPALHIHDTDP